MKLYLYSLATYYYHTASSARSVFACMENWDLEAVVRGYNTFNNFKEPPFFAPPSRIELEDLHFLSFHGVSETVTDNIGEKLHSHEELQIREEPKEKMVQELQRQASGTGAAPSPVASSTSSPPPTKARKRFV